MSLPDSFIHLLEQHREGRGDRCAYRYLADGERVQAEITYDDLAREAKAVAAEAQAVAAPGERALLLYPPGPEFLSGLFACFYAGLVAVPAYPPAGDKHQRRLLSIIEDAGASVVLTTGSLARQFEAGTGNAMVDAMARIRTDEVDPARSSAWREVAVGPDTLAMLQYTSGSTGAPKGVMLSHRNLVHNCSILSETTAHDDDPVFVSWLPQFHDMGLIAKVLQSLYLGSRCVLMPPEAFLRDPVRWLRAITAYGGTFSGGPNFAFDLCVRRIAPEALQGLDLRSWKVAVNAAEPIRAETLERFTEAFAPYGFDPGAHFPGYGLAESTVFVTGSVPGRGARVRWVDADALGRGRVQERPEGARDARPAVCSGWAPDEVELRIVDPDTRAPCPAGAVGEVWVRSESVGGGYWGNEEATSETFRARLADPGEDGWWLRTGDLAFTDETGGLYITGRIKDVIILRGQNHYPQDLERTAEEAHPLVRPGCSAAFTVEVAGDERLVLVSEIRDESPGDEESQSIVTAVSAALLEEHGLAPAAVSLIRPRTIAKTSSGKIARRATREAFLGGELQVVAAWTSATVPWGPLAAGPAPAALGVDAGVAPEEGTDRRSVEQALLNAIAGRCAVPAERLDPRATFAENGLDSAGLVELSEVVSRLVGRHVGPAFFFDHPTVSAAAAALSGERARATGTEPRHDREGPLASEPIAIVGVGSRFPGADSPEALWALLRDGKSAVGPAPDQRRELGLHTGVGAYLDDVAGFDAECFGIAPREATWMDPQQRLLLEVAWEAMEDAGVPTTRLAGRQVGVFVGISNSDYGRLQASHPPNAYGGTGTALSIAANRLSYAFDLRGPSVAVDTACSASLVAVHQACQSLRLGESELAVAGGVNLVLSSHVTGMFSEANMLSPSGLCRTFDDEADGYVRGEGCGVVLLKRLSDALADGDRVRAVIRGSAVNQDGRSNGLTAPNGQAQRQVVRAALRAAGVRPGDVQYVETHGTGTPLGDPIEFEALADAYADAEADHPTLIGSVKTNLGHTESAAGIAGLLKAVLAMERGWVPPHLHLSTVNRHLDADSSRLEVSGEGRPWPDGDERVAGVSSFGFGGTNAHVVLSGPPAEDRPAAAEAAPESSQLLAISAHSRAALTALAERYADRLAEAGPGEFADVCHSARVGRAELAHRLALASPTAAQAREALLGFAGGEPGRGVRVAEVPRSRPPVAFVFTGQGAEYPGMGAELAEWSPLFRRELERCLDALDGEARAAVADAVYGTGEAAAHLERTGVVQPALFAVEYALARIWASWGVAPACVVGHSLGEYVAACVAGVIAPEDAVRLVAHRGALMDEARGEGAMAVLAADAAAVHELITPLAGRVSVAALNGPDQTVISGEAEAVREAIGAAAERGIAAKTHSTRHGFHSPLMEPVLDRYREQVAQVRLSPPRVRVLANVTGEPADTELTTPEYWTAQLRQPVRFADSVEGLLREGCRYVVEIGPRPALTPLVGDAAGDDVSCVVSMRRGKPPHETMLDALAELWAGGAAGELAGVELPGGRSRASLPAYPFQRRRYWLPPRPQAPHGPSNGGRAHPLLGQRDGAGQGAADGHVWTRVLRPSDVPLIDSHRIEGRAILPGVAYMEMAVAAARELHGPQQWALEDVRYQSVLVLPDETGREVRVRLTDDPAECRFSVESRPADALAEEWTLHAQGRLALQTAQA